MLKTTYNPEYKERSQGGQPFNSVAGSLSLLFEVRLRRMAETSMNKEI